LIASRCRQLLVQASQKHLQLLDDLGIALGLGAAQPLLPGGSRRLRIAQRQLHLAQLLPGDGVFGIQCRGLAQMLARHGHLLVVGIGLAQV
jgi:hypothetical protein